MRFHNIFVHIQVYQCFSHSLLYENILMVFCDFLILNTCTSDLVFVLPAVPLGTTLEDFCPLFIHRNMTWRTTYKGQTVIQACPPGTLGNAFISVMMFYFTFVQ